MTATLFKNFNTEQSPFVKMVRELTFDDLSVETLTPSKKHDNNSQRLAFKYFATLNEKVARELVEAFGIDSRAEKSVSLTSPVYDFVERTGETLSLKPFITVIQIETFSYRGVRSDAQEAHYEKLVAEATARAEEKMEAAKEELVKKISDKIKEELLRGHKKFEEELHDILVNTNISTEWLEENLSERDKETISAHEQEVERIDIEIKRLQNMRNATRLASRNTKRACAERHLTRQFASTECEEMINILDNVKAEKTTESARRFLLG